MKRSLLLVCIAIFFTGCAADVSNNASDSTLSVIEEITDNTEKESKTDIDCKTDNTEKDGKTDINCKIELHGIAGDRLELPSDYVIELSEGKPVSDTVRYDGMTYILKSFGSTYTSIDDPDKFSGSEYIGTALVCGEEYEKINTGYSIGGLTVSDAVYSHFFALDSDGNVIAEYSQNGSLNLEGNITLTGILAQAKSSDDYGYDIYGDSIMFFPYAYSLNESDFPALHSEIINAVFSGKKDEKILFYGETLPFEIGDNEELRRLLEEDNGGEFEMTFSTVKQVWFYGNGSGYNPCSAEVISFRNTGRERKDNVQNNDS